MHKDGTSILKSAYMSKSSDDLCDKANIAHTEKGWTVI